MANVLYDRVLYYRPFTTQIIDMVNASEKEFMIAGLRRQRDLLNELIAQLKFKEELDSKSQLLYDQVTRKVEQNLKRLKKFRKDGFEV